MSNLIILPTCSVCGYVIHNGGLIHRGKCEEEANAFLADMYMLDQCDIDPITMSEFEDPDDIA